MNVIEVAGTIVSKNGITLFLTDGNSMVLPQDSWRTQAVLDQILPSIARQQTISVDLDAFRVEKIVEALTGGVVKIEENTITVNETVIETKGELKEYIERSAWQSEAKGFSLFMQNFATIKHQHTAEELLKFMQNGDLPIADDGSILVYKFLDDVGDGVFVDKHTRKVRQKLGSRVSMPAEHVNPDRRQECATGLHVCSAKYGSYGNSVFVAKVWPSDVIAVPRHESGKMRVRAYHLVAKLPSSAYKFVDKHTSAINDASGENIVSKVIAGDHVPVLEEVIVHGSFVTNKEAKIEVIPVDQPQKSAPNKPRRAKIKPAIDPASVRKIVKKAKAEAAVDAREADYLVKFAKAKEMLAEGKSLRAVAKELKMCRESLSNRLKAEGSR